MRQKILLHLMSASALVVALPASAQSARPFVPPSTLQAKAGVKPVVHSASVVQQAPQASPVALSPMQKEAEERKLHEEKEVAEKAEAERISKEKEAERRKKLRLKEGQELVEREFKGARVGNVNGVNIYRSSDSSTYFYENGDKTRYIKVLPEETIKAQAASGASGASGAPGTAKRTSTPAAQKEQRPNLPSTVGRPAPRTP